MSTLGKVFRNLVIVGRNVPVSSKRAVHTSCAVQGNGSDFFSRLLASDPVTKTQSHSSLLSDKKEVYELQVHYVKPECMQDYLAEYERYAKMMSEKTKAQLTGSWTVEIGEQDEAIHLWKFPGGYPVLNDATQIYRTDQDFVQYRLNRNTMIRSRRNEILLPFKFWGEIQPRDGKWIYELRSYSLKHGKSLDWGRSWAHGIKHRTAEDERVAGFYTHIGQATQVHHFWAYKSLQSRDAVRGAAWSKDGWNECVSNTVPLIRYMNSRIMIPTPYSPLQ